VAVSGDTSGVLQLATNGGTTAVTIDTSQNVGIGTTSPKKRLTIVDASSSSTTPGTNPIVWVGGGNANINTISEIGFTYGANSYAETYAPATIGYQLNNANAYSYGSLTFSTRSVNTDTAPTERMRLDKDGTLCVGVTSAIASNIGGISVKSTVGNGYPCLNAWNTTAGTGGAPTYFCYFGSGSSFNSVGSITNNGTTTLYNATSDQRLKENIVDAGSALEKLSNIKIRSFNWIENKQFVDFGVIAQEINTIAPEAVSQGEDNEDGSIKMPWQVDTSTLVPAMIKAIQEQQALITQLQADVAALKGA
jgi:hypothetical protein